MSLQAVCGIKRKLWRDAHQNQAKRGNLKNSAHSMSNTAQHKLQQVKPLVNALVTCLAEDFHYTAQDYAKRTPKHSDCGSSCAGILRRLDMVHQFSVQAAQDSSPDHTLLLEQISFCEHVAALKTQIQSKWVEEWLCHQEVLFLELQQALHDWQTQHWNLIHSKTMVTSFDEETERNTLLRRAELRRLGDQLLHRDQEADTFFLNPTRDLGLFAYAALVQDDDFVRRTVENDQTWERHLKSTPNIKNIQAARQQYQQHTAELQELAMRQWKQNGFCTLSFPIGRVKARVWKIWLGRASFTPEQLQQLRTLLNFPLEQLRLTQDSHLLLMSCRPPSHNIQTDALRHRMLLPKSITGFSDLLQPDKFTEPLKVADTQCSI